jgi:hypothetical protein
MGLQAGRIHFIRLFVAMAGLVLVVGRQMPALSADSCPVENTTMIVVERLQSGFAGQTGERTSIGEDGCFIVDRVLNGKALSRLRSGRLGPDRIMSARAAIDIANIASLANRAGESPVVNPTIVSVTYRGVTKAVVMAAGSSLDDIAALGKGPPEDPSARLARLAARLLELTGS